MAFEFMPDYPPKDPGLPLRFGRMLLLCLILQSGAWAWGQFMPAPPEGTIESGVPNFVVLGPEALGLSAAPTDLHQLPDGRGADPENRPNRAPSPTR